MSLKDRLQVSLSPKNDTQKAGALQPSSHIRSLDSLRGLAAVCVVLHHFWYALVDGTVSWYLLPFLSGDSAVVLFFVLSGYVLSLPAWSHRTKPYLAYIIGRICRIYLPFMFALGVALLGAWLFRKSTLTLTPWFNQTWHTAITPRLVRQQLLMRPTSEVNTAFWTLRYEMQMSFLMPLLCLALRRWSAPIITAFGALALCSVPILPVRWNYVDQTCVVAVLFAIGATLAGCKEQIHSFFAAIGAKAWLLLARFRLSSTGNIPQGGSNTLAPRCRSTCRSIREIAYRSFVG